VSIIEEPPSTPIMDFSFLVGSGSNGWGSEAMWTESVVWSPYAGSAGIVLIRFP